MWRNTVIQHRAASTIEPKFAKPERHTGLAHLADKLGDRLKTDAGKLRQQRGTAGPVCCVSVRSGHLVNPAVDQTAQGTARPAPCRAVPLAR